MFAEDAKWFDTGTVTTSTSSYRYTVNPFKNHLKDGFGTDSSSIASLFQSKNDQNKKSLFRPRTNIFMEYQAMKIKSRENIDADGLNAIMSSKIAKALFGIPSNPDNCKTVCLMTEIGSEDDTCRHCLKQQSGAFSLKDTCSCVKALLDDIISKIGMSTFSQSPKDSIETSRVEDIIPGPSNEKLYIADCKGPFAAKKVSAVPSISEESSKNPQDVRIHSCLCEDTSSPQSSCLELTEKASTSSTSCDIEFYENRSISLKDCKDSENAHEELLNTIYEQSKAPFVTFNDVRKTSTVMKHLTPIKNAVIHRQEPILILETACKSFSTVQNGQGIASVSVTTQRREKVPLTFTNEPIATRRDSNALGEYLRGSRLSPSEEAERERSPTLPQQPQEDVIVPHSKDKKKLVKFETDNLKLNLEKSVFCDPEKSSKPPKDQKERKSSLPVSIQEVPFEFQPTPAESLKNKQRFQPNSSSGLPKEFEALVNKDVLNRILVNPPKKHLNLPPTAEKQLYQPPTDEKELNQEPTAVNIYRSSKNGSGAHGRKPFKRSNKPIGKSMKGIFNKDNTLSLLPFEKELNTDVPHQFDMPFINVHPAGITLTRPGYYTSPTLEELAYMTNEMGQCIVYNFLIGREDYGSVFFEGELDITGMNFDQIIHIRRKELVVYPDDSTKPPVGEGLNRRAEVTLECSWPIDAETLLPITDPVNLQRCGWVKDLELATEKMGAHFLEFKFDTGSWVFLVNHFSRYSLHEAARKNLKLLTLL